MKRIAVVGCPGSGKTTFTRKLAKKVDLPLVHLDHHYHQTKYDYYNDKQAWIKKVTQIISGDQWIIDGNYSSTMPLRFERADVIIFFDFPRWLSMYGVIKRRITYHNKLREEMPSDWKEKANLEFLKYVWRFREDSRRDILDALKEHNDKEVHIFIARKHANDFLRRL